MHKYRKYSNNFELEIPQKSGCAGNLWSKKRNLTSKAVTPLLLEARFFFSFFNMVSYSMNCMEGLLTCDQEQEQSAVFI